MPKLIPRRALKRGKSPRKNPEWRRRRWAYNTLMRRSGGKCEYCGAGLHFGGDDPDSATMDHVVPLSQGGLDVPKNLRLACRACNQSKGAMPVDEWLDLRDMEASSD